MVKRREFLRNLATGGALAVASPAAWGATSYTGGSDKLGAVLPTRPLGKTGEQVTIYCMGGSHVAKAASEKESQAIIEKGLELGVRFFENAWTYARGRAEELYGKYLIPKYRDEIFLATKNKGMNAAEARQQMEDSFRRLKCDKIDLYYIHEIRSPEDVENRLNEGVLEVLLKAQQDGKVRYLGFTGHTITAAHKKMIEKVAGKDPFVAVQIPVNPVDAIRPDSFTLELIPVLKKQGYAVMAMKTLAHGRFLADNMDHWPTSNPVIPDHISVDDVFQFVLSQPITALVSGTDHVEQVTHNVQAVKNSVPLGIQEQQAIMDKVRGFKMTEGLEYYRPEPGTY